MKRLIPILLVAVLLVVSGCSKESGQVNNISQVPVTNNQAEQNQEKEIEQTENKEAKSSLEGLKQSFKDAGFKVGENEVVAYEMVSATNGMKFMLDDELVEIYEYDLDNLTDEAKDIVDQAENGSIEFSGFNIPVVYKDGLMLVRHDEHSQGEKIVEVFNNYK